MKSWVLASILVAGMGQAYGETGMSKAEINQLQAQCGDDVLCYFSQNEVQEALGENAAQTANSGMFDINGANVTDVEYGPALSVDSQNLLQITDFSARKRTAKASGKAKSKAKRGSGVNMNAGAHTGAPIWGSFITKFRVCAPGCVPANVGTFGGRSNYSPTAGVGNFSCHPTGQAIDVGAIVCGGTAYKAINNGRFSTFVSCMKNKGKMKTLFHDKSLKKYGKTRGHYDHAHFSNGCTAADGNRWI